MTTQDASQIAAEALSFIAAYDRSNTYETFWDHYLSRFGSMMQSLQQPDATESQKAALHMIQDALDPFCASHVGKLDTDSIMDTP